MKQIFLICIGIFVSSAVWSQVATNTETANSTQSSPFSQSKFVPDISLIVDFSMVGRNLGDEKYQSLGIPGFTYLTAGNYSPSDMNVLRGFNLNYCELALASVVDPYFDLTAIFHLSTEGFEIEEAFFITRALPAGFQIKAGKFLSDFGRINSQHEHFWDFVDPPIVHKVFFGEEGLNEKGIRLTYVVPISFYMMLGGEVFQGQNEVSFGAEGFEDAAGSHHIKNSNSPNLFVGYSKASFDIGKLTVQNGLSFAGGRTRINNGVDDAGNSEGYGIFANTAIIGGDLTLKYSINSYQYLSWQTEYMYRNMDGKWYDTTGDKKDLSRNQTGLYSQLIYHFSLRWRLGIRYDLLQKNEIRIGNAPMDLPENLSKYSAMIDFGPTEFSRLRLQFNLDQSGYLNEGEYQKSYHEVILQFNLAMGAHGAHSF